MNRRSFRVYLAGPDVFFSDPKGRGEALKEQCRREGLEGVYPLDAEIALEGLEPLSKGYSIYRGNIALIQSCVGVLANISPFRGPSADVGTAFEIGYGAALGLPIVCYTDTFNVYADRVQPDGLLIEDFGMVDNLMLHAAAGGRICRTAAVAAATMYEFLMARAKAVVA
jgi:nucleoside 2-deoxyribosyltransferase